jgi:hypothetical protein
VLKSIEELMVQMDVNVLVNIKKSFTTTLNQTWNINHLAISSFNNKQTSNDMNVATPKSQWA